MRIVVTCSKLTQLAGTELHTLELARELKALGHKVLIFSPEIGKLGFELAAKYKVPVADFGSIALVIKFQPDIVHVHHWPAYQLLVDKGLTSKRYLFSFLGWKPPVENPPPIQQGVCPNFISISEVVESNILSKSGWNARGSLGIIRVWGALKNIPKLNEDATGIAVISNHFPEKYEQFLRLIAKQKNMRIDFFGAGHKITRVTLDLLNQYEIVVSLGRTVVQGMALMKPVLVLDANGLDGWVTEKSYGLLRAKNFSGWSYANTAFNYPELESYFDNMPTTKDLEYLKLAALEQHSLEQSVKRLENIYFQLMTSPPDTFMFRLESDSADEKLLLQFKGQATDRTSIAKKFLCKLSMVVF